MEYTTLGESGLSVSRIGLGCMGFGLDRSDKYEWSIGEQDSKAIIERAIDLGVTFFDTANSYSWGDSERVLGNALAEYDREELVVASKVYHPSSNRANPNASGLSRKTITHELEMSLDRLGMETLDLYQIHRWDDDTPIDETLRTLDDAVRRRRVRYLGASSMWAHQFATARHTATSLGLEEFVSMQNHYNLVYREEEREMLPYCESAGVGITPWSPLARGYLTRPHGEFETTTRGKQEAGRSDDRHAVYRASGGIEINRRVEELADEKDLSMGQIALAWLLHTDPVDAPIIGTTSIDHLEDAVAALDISLSRSERDYLEAPYNPVSVVGHS